MKVLKENLGKGVFGILALFLISWGVLTWGFGYHGPAYQKEAVDTAVADLQSRVCAAQFLADPAVAKNFANLKEKPDYNRAEIIEKGGWAKVPGIDGVAYGVSRQCAEIVMAAGPPKAAAIVKTNDATKKN